MAAGTRNDESPQWLDQSGPSNRGIVELTSTETLHKAAVELVGYWWRCGCSSAGNNEATINLSKRS